VLYRDKELVIRPIQQGDLRRIWEFSYREKWPEWKDWDAPYYEHKTMSWEQYQLKDNVVDQEDEYAIEVNGTVVGTVCYYWEHEPSNWLEMGIVIFDPQYWSGGVGTRALRLWTNHLFCKLPLVRVGFTTWSGNERMIKVGEKLGMTMEARLRKCRLYNGTYYDSIRMGLLREEWEYNDIFK
jgi:RimJ/RimL family protein N-acetyltransferase